MLKEYTAPLVDIDECIEAWEPHPSLTPRLSNVCLNVTWGAPCHVSLGLGVAAVVLVTVIRVMGLPFSFSCFIRCI